MRKRLIWLLGIGISLCILSFIINVYSVLRLVSLLLGIILIVVSYSLKKKRNILLIILLSILLGVFSYGVDMILVFKLKHIPVFSYSIKSSDYVSTYNSFFYRVYDCRKTLVLDYGYNKKYACGVNDLDVISINKLLQDSKDYKNKFVKVYGKISKISGNESIEMASFNKDNEVLNGYVNFNLDNVLRISVNEDLSKYRIYDYISVIGCVKKGRDGVVFMEDVVLIPSDMYLNYTYEVINSKDNEITNLLKEKDYYYLGLDSINVKYDQDNIYELSYLLADEKMEFNDIIKDKEYKNIKNKEGTEEAYIYYLDKFNVIKCINNKKIFVNKSIKINNNVCDFNID